MSAEMEVGAKRCGAAVSSNLSGEPGTRPKPEFEINQPGQNQIAKTKKRNPAQTRFRNREARPCGSEIRFEPGRGVPKSIWFGRAPPRPPDSQIPNVAGRAPPPRRPRRTRFQVKPGSEIWFKPRNVGTWFEPDFGTWFFRNLVITRFRSRQPGSKIWFKPRNRRTWFAPDFGTWFFRNLVITRFRRCQPGSEIWLKPRN